METLDRENTRLKLKIEELEEKIKEKETYNINFTI